MSAAADVVIYSRPGCHLCDAAHESIRALLDEYSSMAPTLRVVNVETDPDLEAAYGTEVPLVSINGSRAFPYRGDAEALERELTRLWTP